MYKLDLESIYNRLCLPEKLQRVGVAVFPMIKMWLENVSMPRTEIFQPICSFLAMTLANNSRWKLMLVDPDCLFKV